MGLPARKLGDELGDRLCAVSARLGLVEDTLAELLRAMGAVEEPTRALAVVRPGHRPDLRRYELVETVRVPEEDTADHFAFVMRWRCIDERCRGHSHTSYVLEMLSLSPRDRLAEYVDVGREPLEEEESA